MKLIYNYLDNDIKIYNNLLKNKYIYTITEILIESNYNLKTWTMKLEIRNNKLIILKPLTKEAGAFKRRGDGIIKLINLSLEKHKIKNIIFYIYVGDEFNYKFTQLPIFILAKPQNKFGILFPDQTFLDIEPEVYTEQNNNKPKTITEIKDINLNIKNKTPEIFFIGQNIGLIDTQFNIRQQFNKFKKPFNIIIDGTFMKMNKFSDYKYLLNLPGNYPWSFRFKFLFMMRSLVININLYNMKYKSDEKWINIMDNLFIKNKDYIELDYYFDENINQTENINEIEKKILEIYNYYEDKNNYKQYLKIVNNGYKKSKLININNVCNIVQYILNNCDNIQYYNSYKKYKTIEKYINDSNFINKGFYANIYDYSDNNNNKVIKVSLNTLGHYETYKELFIYNIFEINNLNNYFTKLYDFFIYNKKTYLIFEKLDYSVKDITMNNITFNDYKKIYTDILEQMKLLHKYNIIHNDIQPQNIMYSKKNNKYYLIDFGLSYSKSYLTTEDLLLDYELFKNIPNKYRTNNIYKKIKNNPEKIAKYYKFVSDEYLKELKKKYKNKQNYILIHLINYYINKNGLYNETDENILFNKI